MLRQPPLDLVFQLVHAGIDGISPQQILFQHTSRPLPELDTKNGIYPIANRDDGVKIVETYFARDLALPFNLNDRGFLGSCPLIQFATRINVLEMQSDIVSRASKQRRHLTLRQPDGLVLKPHVQPHRLVRLVHDNLILRVRHFTPRFSCAPPFSSCARRLLTLHGLSGVISMMFSILQSRLLHIRSKTEAVTLSPRDIFASVAWDTPETRCRSFRVMSRSISNFQRFL